MPKRKRKLDAAGIAETRATALASVAEQNFAAALRALDRLISSGDVAPECLLLRSVAQLALSEGKITSARLPKALKDAETACKRAPMMPEARLAMARVLLAQGDPFGAEIACVHGIRRAAAKALALQAGGEGGSSGTPAPPAPPAPSAPPRPTGDGTGLLWVGCTVIVVGTSREDLNGQEASVTAHREDSGRYCVLLRSGEKQEPKQQEVALKLANLSLPFAAALLTAREVRTKLEHTLSQARAEADPRREKAMALKTKANASFSSGSAMDNNDQAKVPLLLEALGGYTEATELCPQDAVLFSNRAACHMMLGKCDPSCGGKWFKKAVQDAKRCVKLRPTWPKAYHRLGTAHFLVSKSEGGCFVSQRRAGQCFLDGFRRCYPLSSGCGAPASTEGQAMETHCKGDAMFKSLTAGWQEINPLVRPTTTTEEQQKKKVRGYGGRDTTYT